MEEDDTLAAWKALDVHVEEEDLGYEDTNPPRADHPHPHHGHHPQPHTHHHHHHSRPQRFKRKNFSKQLQLLCLERYAHHAKTHGKLPDKTETQFLLHQSYLQFLKEGGAVDEPRLAYPEFLKLIRNRRREVFVRTHTQQQKKSAVETIRRQTTLTPAKRKLIQEHERIRELIEIIDQTREQTGLISDAHRHRLSSTRRGPTPKPQQLLMLTTENGGVTPSPVASSSAALSSATLAPQVSKPIADPREQLEAIFQIQQETFRVQREIVHRLKGIRLRQQHHRRSQQRHDHNMEPSSASV